MARTRIIVLCGLVAIALLASALVAMNVVSAGSDGAAAAKEREAQRELLKKAPPPAKLPMPAGSGGAGGTNYAHPG